MIAIIPAKSTSQRLPGKNMFPLNGKPLLQYAVEAAKESKVFDDVIVSSDSDEIQAFAYSLGAMGCERNLRLANDVVTVFDVVKDILSFVEVDSFAVLLPTSPFRSKEDIKLAYKAFTESDTECLMSISKYDYPPQWALEKIEGRTETIDCIEGIKVGKDASYEDYETIRQKLTPLYKHDGSIIMCHKEPFLNSNDWLDMITIPYYTPKERSIDIDTIEDLKYAEWLMSMK